MDVRGILLLLLMMLPAARSRNSRWEGVLMIVIYLCIFTSYFKRMISTKANHQIIWKPAGSKRELSLEIAAGEVVSWWAHQVQAKPPLLQILGTLSKQDAGGITMNGIGQISLSRTRLARFRNRHIGFVFQFHQLLARV